MLHSTKQYQKSHKIQVSSFDDVNPPRLTNRQLLEQILVRLTNVESDVSTLKTEAKKNG